MDRSLPDTPTAVFLHGILGCRKNWGECYYFCMMCIIIVLQQCIPPHQTTLLSYVLSKLSFRLPLVLVGDLQYSQLLYDRTIRAKMDQYFTKFIVGVSMMKLYRCLLLYKSLIILVCILSVPYEWFRFHIIIVLLLFVN